MKEKLETWAKRKAADVREVSQEISWSAQKLYGVVRKTVSDAELLKKPELPRKGAAPIKGKPAAPKEPRRTLTAAMEQAVHGAYYKEGGFRFYADGLLQYAAVHMDSETDAQALWAAAYNSNLRFMILQTRKLQKELQMLTADYGCQPLPLKNGTLLQAMVTLTRRVSELGLDREENWQAEAYRQTVWDYISELQTLLPDLRQSHREND